jgi:hypothetical protein
MKCFWLRFFSHHAIITFYIASFSVLPVFKPAAEELLRNSDLSAAELLAKALARIGVS